MKKEAVYYEIKLLDGKCEYVTATKLSSFIQRFKSKIIGYSRSTEPLIKPSTSL